MAKLCDLAQRYWIAYLDEQTSRNGIEQNGDPELNIVMYDNEAELMRTGPDWNLFTYKVVATYNKKGKWQVKSSSLEFTLRDDMTVKDIKEELSRINECFTFVQLGFLTILFNEQYYHKKDDGFDMDLCLWDDILGNLTVENVRNRVLGNFP